MSKHEPKMPVTAMPLLVTPAKAREWLAAHNHGNRNLRPTQVSFLADEITEGRWVMNNDAVCFSSEKPARLINGQHRLHAIDKANKAAMLLVAYNVDPAAFKTMDIGSKRSFTDLTGLPSTITADASLLRLLREGPGAKRSSAVQIEEIAEWWRPAHDAVVQGSGGLRRSGLDSSPIRVGVGLRWAIEKTSSAREHVLRQYRLLLENDTQKLDRAVATFWQRVAKARLSNTREGRISLACQAFYYLDPRRADSVPLIRNTDEVQALVEGWVEGMEDAFVRAPAGAKHPYAWVEAPKVDRKLYGAAAAKVDAKMKGGVK